MSEKITIPKDAFRVRWSEDYVFCGRGDKNRRGIGWRSRNFPYRIRVLWEGRETPSTYLAHRIHRMIGEVKP